MQIIDTFNMPKSNGHYSQCISHNGLPYLSGQLPLDPSKKSIPVGISAQTGLVLKNIEHILKDHKPVRCIRPTRELHYGCLIEVEVTAVV